MTTRRIHGRLRGSAPSLLFALVCCLLLWSSAVSGSLSSAVLSSVTSTSLTISVSFTSTPASTEIMKVLAVPEDDSARSLTVAAPLASPTSVSLSSLTPDTLYAFRFTLVATNGNITSTLQPSFRTNRLGPAVLGFQASDPHSDGVTDFSSGDQLTLSFDGDTNQPDVSTKTAIDSIFSFSESIGSDYTGSWSSASVLLITISDAGDATPTLGLMTVTIVGDIHSPDGLSDISVSTSPPLIGTWSYVSFLYFRPRDQTTGGAIASPTYASYNTQTLVNTAKTLPMAITFPSDASMAGYVVTATVVYPVSTAGSFVLAGTSFVVGALGGTNNLTTLNTYSNNLLGGIVPTITLTPPTGFLGYSLVFYQLFNRLDDWSLVDTAYMVVDVRLTLGGALAIPLLSSATAASASKSWWAKHELPLIIGCCGGFGLIVLLVLCFCARRKVRARRDSKDFESKALTANDSLAQAEITKTTDSKVDSSSAEPTRRFYFEGPRNPV